MDKAELDEYLAGLAIDDQGHIVAVDLVSPTVFRITENGELVKWFDCSDQRCALGWDRTPVGPSELGGF